MNDLPFELFVAIRYLLAKRKQAFISLISFISILGVGVGVMAVLIAMALMTGLQKELRERIVGSSAHVYVFKLGEGIRDVAAVIEIEERGLELRPDSVRTQEVLRRVHDGVGLGGLRVPPGKPEDVAE